MIVKIACNDERTNWRWYDADHVQSCTLPESEMLEVSGASTIQDIAFEGSGEINEDVILSEHKCDGNGEPARHITLITFMSPDGTPNNIYTDFAAFLLNDSGATVDRLH